MESSAMKELNLLLSHSSSSRNESSLFVSGGLFLEQSVPNSFVSSVSASNSSALFPKLRCHPRGKGFLSVSLSVKGKGRFVQESEGILEKNGEKPEGNEEVEEERVVVERKKKKKKERARSARTGAMNTTKHLWAGAVAAMVSRTFVAPLERLKLEYNMRGEQKHLFELIKQIASTQGLRGFWKGNFVNILRTAPFKAINFYAYDTYRKELLKLSGNNETTNFERFVAGAAAWHNCHHSMHTYGHDPDKDGSSWR